MNGNGIPPRFREVKNNINSYGGWLKKSIFSFLKLILLCFVLLIVSFIVIALIGENTAMGEFVFLLILIPVIVFFGGSIKIMLNNPFYSTASSPGRDEFSIYTKFVDSVALNNAVADFLITKLNYQKSIYNGEEVYFAITGKLEQSKRFIKYKIVNNIIVVTCFVNISGTEYKIGSFDSGKLLVEDMKFLSEYFDF